MEVQFDLAVDDAADAFDQAVGLVVRLAAEGAAGFVRGNRRREGGDRGSADREPAHGAGQVRLRHTLPDGTPFRELPALPERVLSGEKSCL